MLIPIKDSFKGLSMSKEGGMKESLNIVVEEAKGFKRKINQYRIYLE